MSDSNKDEKPAMAAAAAAAAAATLVEVRTCSAYAIPLETEKQVKQQQQDEEGSSVIDKDIIAARGINPQVSRDQVSAEIEAFMNLPFSFQNEQRMLLTIVMFLSYISVPVSVDLHPGFLMKGMVYFPLVGMVVGLAVATVYDFSHCTLQLPPIIAAAMSTGAGWYLTGCLHEDGLGDSADGIGGGWTRDQIFKIMTDSRVGTYGCAVLSLYTTTKVQLLAALGESTWNCGGCQQPSLGAGPALIVAHSMARVTAPYLIRSFDYVDDEQGPKSSFYAFMIQAKYLVSLPRVLGAMAFGFSLSWLLYGPVIAITLMIATLSFAQMAGNYGNAKLGGVMGDFLGATICVAELFILGLLLVAQQGSPWRTWAWFWQASASVHTISDLLQIVLDRRISALIRCLIGFGVLKGWLAMVSYSNRRAKTREKPNNGISNVTAEVTKDSDQSSGTEESNPKSAAVQILSLPTSTYRERYDAVQSYMDVLAKPVGSLGTLECWGAKLAALQRTLQPKTNTVLCLIFAGDHGAAATPEDGGEGCSAYPQAVTRSVLVGLERGVAGASVLARANNVTLRVIDVGVHLVGGDNPFQAGKIVNSSPQKLLKGTRNFCAEAAMSAEECQRCIAIGRDRFLHHVEETSANAVVLGEVGIGNTTSSSAIIAALTQKPVDELCGGGAFAKRQISEDLVTKKIDIVTRALAKHYAGSKSIQAADALAKLGGAEIAAIVGALLEASDRDTAILVDGFIATAAALVAVCISPSVCRVLFFATNSAEPGQRAAIEKIRAIAEENNIPVENGPVLSMDLRMGEGTAALLAVPILRSSAMVLSEMATIQDILS